LNGKIVSTRKYSDFPLRGADMTQNHRFSYRTLEERIPKAHPLRPLRAVVDILLTTRDAELEALYATARGVSRFRLSACRAPA
jgi:hypothetical protein